ncbi:MAG: NUDIX domain-containing protein [Colwellia sp.]|jgi:ADP-ribose pyrophosphatase
MLSLEIFKTVIASTPLISIVLIAHNSKQEVLLGKRLNKPAQGFWFVLGGRILKDESLRYAFKRLVKTELGISVHNRVFKGICQHFYNDNVTGPDFSTHYVVLPILLFSLLTKLRNGFYFYKFVKIEK